MGIFSNTLISNLQFLDFLVFNWKSTEELIMLELHLDQMADFGFLYKYIYTIPSSIKAVLTFINGEGSDTRDRVNVVRRSLR